MKNRILQSLKWSLKFHNTEFKALSNDISDNLRLYIFTKVWPPFYTVPQKKEHQRKLIIQKMCLSTKYALCIRIL